MQLVFYTLCIHSYMCSGCGGVRGGEGGGGHVCSGVLCSIRLFGVRVSIVNSPLRTTGSIDFDLFMFSQGLNSVSRL